MSSYLRVLRTDNFRYLFFGQALSNLGDFVVIVALALYVTQTTGSATDVGLVFFGGSAPLVALILFGGVWADRLPRHRIMIAADVVRGAAHALLATLIFIGAAPVWAIAAIEVVFGSARAFFQPAYAGLMPQTVPEELVQDAKALSETVANAAFMLGPLIGTALVLGIGAGYAFAFDAISFAVSALLLARVRPRARGPEPEPSSSVIADLAVGWREVRSRAWVWATIVAFTGLMFAVFAQWYSLAPLISRSVYGSAGLFGLFESAIGVGAVVGAIAGVRWRPRRPLWTGLTLALVWPCMTLSLALGLPAVVVAVCAFGTGFAFSLLTIWWEVALATHIPPSALSRVSAYDWMGSAALMPFGYLAAGALASAFGARAVLGVGSVVGIVLLMLARAPRSTRELGVAVAPPAEAPPARRELQPSSSLARSA
jgi:MFS family permease